MPVSTTVWFWLSTDALTLCLLLAAVVWRRQWMLMPVIGVLLGMQHFEQGVLAAMITLSVALLHDGWRNALSPNQISDPYPFAARSALGLAVGAVIGKAVLVGLFAHYDIVVNAGRWIYLANYWQIYVQQFFTTIPFAVWSVFGVGWLLVVRFLDRGTRVHATAFATVLILALLVLLPLMGDKTRVIAIVTFPVVTVSLLLNQRLLAQWSDRQATHFLLLWIAVPWIWVALGSVHLSKFPDDMVWLWKGLAG